MQETERQLTQNEKKIIKLGKANDRLNKYCIKVTLPPVVIAVILILLYGFSILTNPTVILVGISLLFIGCCIPVVWFISLTIRASKIGYTYQLYQELIGNHCNTDDTVNQKETHITKNSHCESDNEITPEQNQERLTDAYIKQFDGDIEKALEHILYTYEYEELDKYVFEWTEEENRIAYKIIERNAAKNMAKESNPCIKKLLIQLIITSVVCVGIPLLLSFIKNIVSDFETVQRYAMGGLSIFIAFQAMKIATTIIDTIKYQKEKRKSISKYKDEIATK